MLRIRSIQTQTIIEDGQEKHVPVLDKDGNEIEEYVVEVPQHVVVEGPEAVNAYVAEQLSSPPTPPAEGEE